MNRLSKAILVTIATLVILGVALVFGVNLYVQSPGVQARIKAQLTQALGVPIELTTMTVGWSGARLAGVRVPVEGKTFLEAEAFAADYRLLPLLRQELVITKITIESPKVTWEQNSEGKWILPGLPEKVRKEGAPKASEPSEKKEKERFQVAFDQIEVTNGSIELLDSKQRRIALADGVAMHYAMPSSGEITGALSARSIAWADAPPVTDVHTSMKFAGGALEFPDLQGALGGGLVKAKGTVQTKTKDSPYELSVELEGIDIGKLTSEGGWKAYQASGKLAGSLTGAGDLGQSGPMHGKVVLTMTEGQIHGLDLFEAIGQVLQIPELTDFRVRIGRLAGEYGDDRFNLSELDLETADLKFSAKGVAKYDEKLKMDAGLYLSDKVAQKMPGFVRDKLGAPDEAGRRGLAFNISGTLGHPKTDIWDKIVGKGLTDQLGDLVGGLFGKKKEKKKKEKQEAKVVESEITPPAKEPVSPPTEIKPPPAPVAAPAATPAATPAAAPASSGDSQPPAKGPAKEL